MPGPPPNPQARRRNAPTIATTVLPAEGRTAPPPDVPEQYELGESGMAWWDWAWRVPQATQWDEGTTYLVARRARLEDDLAALDFVDHVDLADLLAGAATDAIRNAEWALSTLKRSASGATGLMKEMREIDDRLGLSPKSMVALRWSVAESAEPAATSSSDDVAQIADYRSRLG
jgi:hypothetical protein